jgi:hypothetical protein
MTNNPQISTSRVLAGCTVHDRNAPQKAITFDFRDLRAKLKADRTTLQMSAWFRASNATANAQASAFDQQVGVIIADEGKLLSATIEGGHSLKCRKGANRVTLAVGRSLPVYPDERTPSVYSGMCNTNPLCRGWIN